MSERGIPTPSNYDPPNRPKAFNIDSKIGKKKIEICMGCKKELYGKYIGQFINGTMEYFCDDSCRDLYLNKPEQSNICLSSCGSV